ncbi:exportin-1 (CRM1) [Vairimorpha necatrix]|uniref:Exportin-1 (CRM1) n=1 Tax=Vairimorpha necatrix TaxID=6039 RepID=A0AAX4J8N7_9MICR
MQDILNPDKDFNVTLFDEIVLNANDPTSPRKSEAEGILLKFKKLSTSCTKVHLILQYSTFQQSHYVALQILEETVKSKWYVLDEENKRKIREYVFQLVIEKTKGNCQNYVIQELNRIIVEIAKRDWPKRWPNFILDLIDVSTNISMGVCKNTLEIIKKLNNDINMKGDDRISTVKRRILKNQMKMEFPTIFNFIKRILEYSKVNAVDDILLEATLSTFSGLISSMPVDFIFLTDIVELLCEHINSAYSDTCLICLIEIVDLGKDKTNFKNVNLINANEEKIWIIFTSAFQFLESYMKKFSQEKVFEMYRHMESPEKNFIFRISQLFASIFEIYTTCLEYKNIQTVRIALEHMILFSRINDSKIFLVLFEMWNKFVFDLYTEFPFNNKEPRRNLRRFEYKGVLAQLLNCLVEKMPRPEEVFIMVDEYGEIIKNKLIETDQIEFYKKMKSCFYHLAFLIEDEMKRYFISKTGAQLEDKELDWAKINRLCWSIGCISGVFTEESERDFFVSVLKYLLVLCDMREKRSDKAVIASNIMFVIGQFHRFLVHNKSFLKTVVKKLFEFMDESNEGVKDMACDNFSKIAERCPREFLLQRENNMIFLVYILENINDITKSLEFYQKRFVYEAVLNIIKEIPREENNKETILKNIQKLMFSICDINIFSEEYFSILESQISEVSNLKMIIHVLKSHALIYKFVPFACESSYETLFPLYFRLYDLCNNFMISSGNSDVVINSKAAKSALVELFIEIVDGKFVKDLFITQLCEKIIFDFNNNPKYKDPSILALAISIIKNIQRENNIQYVQIELFFISALLRPSIPYAMKADENPEISLNYLKLVETFIDSSFISFYSNIYNSDVFTPIYNSILNAITSMREISDVALKILISLFTKCFENNQMAFFAQNFTITMENLLGIIFDKDTKHSFILQVSLLSLMINISQRIPSLDGQNQNSLVLSNHMLSLFSQNFSNITEKNLKIFISGLFELSKNEEFFREHLEDFSVKIFEFGTDEDIEEEMALLNERIVKSQETKQ